jgi:hypothetical protein
VAFRTSRCTGYARAAPLGADPAWEMHLQVPNRTNVAAPVQTSTWNEPRIGAWNGTLLTSPNLRRRGAKRTTYDAV